jgi:hypothetical protein
VCHWDLQNVRLAFLSVSFILTLEATHSKNILSKQNFMMIFSWVKSCISSSLVCWFTFCSIGYTMTSRLTRVSWCTFPSNGHLKSFQIFRIISKFHILLFLFLLCYSFFSPGCFPMKVLSVMVSMIKPNFTRSLSPCYYLPNLHQAITRCILKKP